MLYRALHLLARLIMWTQVRLHVAGHERVPARGSVLLVSNHLGPTDQFVIGLRLRRRMHILAKVELFRVPGINWILRRAGVIPIRRGKSDRAALTAVRHLLAAEACILVFPEGTYAKGGKPAAMLPFKTGAAWLALRTGATIVPVAVWGTERVWMRGRGWKLGERPVVEVRFGTPYRLSPPPGVPLKAALEMLTQDMGERIAAMLPDAYRGQYRAISSGSHSMATPSTSNLHV